MRVLRVVGVVGALFGAGCTGRDYHPASIAAVSLPDSTSGHGPGISVTVYTFRVDCTVATERTPFVTVNDSTLELRVNQTDGTPSVGCPGGIGADEFVLPPLPAKRLHVRFVGSNTVEATINGGALPSAGVHEVFRFRDTWAHSVDSLSVLIIGCQEQATGYWACRDTLALLGVDSAGVAIFEATCELGGSLYRAEAPHAGWRYGLQSVELGGRFHCGTPWQTIVELGP